MALELIKSRLKRLDSLVEGWNDHNISAIERDLALEHLRAIYDELSSAGNTATVAPQPANIAAAEPEPAEAAFMAAARLSDTAHAPQEAKEPVTPIDDPIDIDALLGLSAEEYAAETLPTAAPAEPAPAAEPEEEPAAVTAADQPAVSVNEEPVAEPETEPVAEPAAEPEPEPVPESAPEAEAAQEPAGEPAANPMKGLFDINEIPIRSKRRRNVMISLYDEPAKPLMHDDAPAPAAAAKRREDESEQRASVGVKHETATEYAAEPAKSRYAPAAEDSRNEHASESDTPAEQIDTRSHPKRYTAPVTPSTTQPTRLADILSEEVTTLADSMIDDKSAVRTAAAVPIDDLNKAIGINDKFLMIRDLFNGDERMYENTIATLNEFDDLDECMIYIVDNFAWNPDSDGARLLMDLIRRKLA